MQAALNSRSLAAEEEITMARKIKSILWMTLLAALVSGFGGTAHAAGPNLSGNWTLNLAKSNFGKFPAPQSITRKITHDGAKLAMTIVQKGAQGEVTSELAYTTDGKPVTNKVQGGESKGSAQWIGDKLMIDSSREIQGTTLGQKDIWSLSADGKTLTIDSHVTLPNGEFDVKQVFEK
jgi:hypothetical protein